MVWRVHYPKLGAWLLVRAEPCPSWEGFGHLGTPGGTQSLQQRASERTLHASLPWVSAGWRMVGGGEESGDDQAPAGSIIQKPLLHGLAKSFPVDSCASSLVVASPGEGTVST